MSPTTCVTLVWNNAQLRDCYALLACIHVLIDFRRFSPARAQCIPRLQWGVWFRMEGHQCHDEGRRGKLRSWTDP